MRKPERKHFRQREQKYKSPITERSLMCLRKEASVGVWSEDDVVQDDMRAVGRV